MCTNVPALPPNTLFVAHVSACIKLNSGYGVDNSRLMERFLLLSSGVYSPVLGLVTLVAYPTHKNLYYELTIKVYLCKRESAF